MPEFVNIEMDGWEHYKKVSYDQLPFKCKECHEYRHFAKTCPKATQEEVEKTQKEGWKQTKKGKKSHGAPPLPPNPSVIHVSQPRASICNQF